MTSGFGVGRFKWSTRRLHVRIRALTALYRTLEVPDKVVPMEG